MFTGYQVSSSGGATFEGNIVIFENRPFGIEAAPNPPGAPGSPAGPTRSRARRSSRRSAATAATSGASYGAGADRTVLLRWYSTQPDPVGQTRRLDRRRHLRAQCADGLQPEHASRAVRERDSAGRCPNPFNNSEWDNLPAQRCFWYQVQKVLPAIDDPYTRARTTPPLRSMVVYVDRKLQARTILTAPGTPVVFNAALISPQRDQRDSPAIHREFRVNRDTNQRTQFAAGR